MKPGPKPSSLRKQQRQLLSEWSDRTLTTWRMALKLIRAADEDPEPYIKCATRPNGSVNVSKLYDMATKVEGIKAVKLVMQEREGDHT